jgi:hypothetical protein
MGQCRRKENEVILARREVDPVVGRRKKLVRKPRPLENQTTL